MAKTLQQVPAFQLMLTEEQFQAIGHVMVQWAFLESEIDKEIAWLLSRSEHRRRCINWRSRFSTRTNIWLELVQRSYKKHPERIKAVCRIIGRANKIKRERDDLAHGNFSSSGTFFKIRDKKVDRSPDMGKPPHIQDLACRISEISVELYQHHVALRKHYRRSLLPPRGS